MHFNKQEQLVLIFIIVTIVIGGGVLIVRQFNPAWFMGKPDFVAGDTQNKTTGDAAEQTETSQPKKEVVVHVTGTVQKPDDSKGIGRVTRYRTCYGTTHYRIPYHTRPLLQYFRNSRNQRYRSKNL